MRNEFRDLKVEWSAMLHNTNRINMPIVIGTYPFVKVDKKLDANDNRLNNTFSYPEKGDASPLCFSKNI